MEIFKTFRRAFRLIRTDKSLACLLAFAGMGIASAQLLEPILFGRVIDSLTKEVGFVRYLAMWGGLGVLNASLSIFLSIMADRFAHRQRMRAMGEVFERTISLPFSFHSLSGSGKVVRTILSGSEQVFYLFLSFFRENCTAVFGVVALVPMAFMLEPRLACVLFTLAAVYAVCNWFVIRRTHSKQMQVELRHQDVAARLVDVMANVTVIRSFTRIGRESELFRDLTNSVLKAQYPVLTWWGVLNCLTRLSSMSAMVTIVAVGSALVHRGEVSAGQVVTFVGFSTLLIARLEQMSSYLNRVVGQAPTLKNLFDLIDQQAGDVNQGGKELSQTLSGRVQFEDVTFQYREKGQGVFGLNFEVEPGETVALVGPSGSGKTTCVSLLQRLFKPNAGRILIDGEDIQDVAVESLCGSVAAVFQEPGLFNRSIYDNILVGRPNATREEVIRAAIRAEAHEFIMARAGGYDFVVGERGMALSGGERQRIAIARAILKEAPILVLDEATSALDNETEKKIQAAMDRLREGKTTFLIAHRLSTIVNADRILVFARGRIVETGTFNELKDAGGLFTRLLDAGQLDEASHHAPHLIEVPLRLEA
jgi:ATP-binding cassette, subfamily B, beta-glucan exporter